MRFFFLWIRDEQLHLEALYMYGFRLVGMKKLVRVLSVVLLRLFSVHCVLGLFATYSVPLPMFWYA